MQQQVLVYLGVRSLGFVASIYVLTYCLVLWLLQLLLMTVVSCIFWPPRHVSTTVPLIHCHPNKHHSPHRRSQSWADFIAQHTSSKATPRRCGTLNPSGQQQHQSLITEQATPQQQVALSPQPGPILSPHFSPMCSPLQHQAPLSVRKDEEDQSIPSISRGTGSTLDQSPIRSPHRQHAPPLLIRKKFRLPTPSQVGGQLPVDPTLYRPPRWRRELPGDAEKTGIDPRVSSPQTHAQTVGQHSPSFHPSVISTHLQLQSAGRAAASQQDTLLTLEGVRQLLLQMPNVPAPQQQGPAVSAAQTESHLSSSSPSLSAHRQLPLHFCPAVTAPQPPHRESSLDVGLDGEQEAALDVAVTGPGSGVTSPHFVHDLPAVSVTSNSDRRVLGVADPFTDSDTESQPPLPPRPAHLSSIFQPPEVTDPAQPILIIHWTLLTWKTKQVIGVSRATRVPVLSSMSLADAAGESACQFRGTVPKGLCVQASANLSRV